MEHRPTYVRAILLSLTIAAMLALLGVWAQRVDVGPGSVPIYDPEGRSYWLAGLAAAVLAAVLFQVFDRETSYALSTAAARQVRYEPASELPTAWLLPGVATFAAVMLLAVYHGETAIAGISLGAFVTLASASIARHFLYDADSLVRQRARACSTLLIHGVAFVALAMVYINKVRSLFSATAVLVIGVLLLLQLTEGEDALFGRRLVYALAGGVMLGQVTWVLNYWKATGWTGGAVLLIFFYLAAGLISAQLRRGVAGRDLAEYGGIAAVAFSIVVYSILR